MATKSAVLAVKIISDAKDFKKGTDEAASGLEKFKGKMSKLTVPALAVGAGLLKVGSDFGKMASDFQQNSGAVDAVFKGMSGQVDKLASESAKKLGLSGNDYKQYSALIGSQLKNAGTPMDQLVGKTDGLINMGADFAAQFGGTVPDAIAAMSSALKGEFDPIEKYGVSLSAAKIEAEAMAMGAKKVNGTLTDQQKQAAILSLINKQGADAMGANAREANTAAGAQARMTAAYTDMGTQLGTILLPIMSKAAEILATVVDWISKNQEMVTILAVGLGILAGAILVLNGVMAVMNVIAALNPFVLLGVAVAALIGFIIYLATQTKFFQTVWAAVAKFCADAWKAFVGFISGVWKGFMGWINGALRNIGSFFSSIFSGIGRFIGTVVNNIRNVLRYRVQLRVLHRPWSHQRNHRQPSTPSVESSTRSSAAVGTIFSRVFNGARSIVLGVINAIVGAFNNISGAVQGAISWVSSLFNGFSVPGWMRDVMKFMGMGSTGFDMTLGTDLTGLPAGMGATGGASMAGFFGGGGSSRTEVTNVNITVNGAIDPVSTAKQIKKLLNADALRNGSINAGGSIY